MTDPTALSLSGAKELPTYSILELNQYHAFISAVHETDNDISSKYDKIGNAQYGCNMSYQYSQYELLR